QFMAAFAIPLVGCRQKPFARRFGGMAIGAAQLLVADGRKAAGLEVSGVGELDAWAIDRRRVAAQRNPGETRTDRVGHDGGAKLRMRRETPDIARAGGRRIAARRGMTAKAQRGLADDNAAPAAMFLVTLRAARRRHLMRGSRLGPGAGVT